MASAPADLDCTPWCGNSGLEASGQFEGMTTLFLYYALTEGGQRAKWKPTINTRFRSSTEAFRLGSLYPSTTQSTMAVTSIRARWMVCFQHH